MKNNKDGLQFNIPEFKSTSGCEHCFCEEEIVYSGGLNNPYESAKNGKPHFKCCMCGTRKLKGGLNK